MGAIANIVSDLSVTSCNHGADTEKTRILEGSASTPGDAALKGSMQLSMFGHTKSDIFATVSGGQYTKDKVLQVSPCFLEF